MHNEMRGQVSKESGAARAKVSGKQCGHDAVRAATGKITRVEIQKGQ